jgi:peptidoglycan/LPS O-acetylase OafA/YrhL
MSTSDLARRPAGVPGARHRGLDGLRGLAALSVVGFHLWLYARPDPPATAINGGFDMFASDLRWGLILFFVLSGFLLYRPWLAAAEDGGAPSLVGYLRRRGARILPAYYLALVGSIALLWNARSVPGVRLPSADTLPSFFVFGQNFSAHSLLTLDPPMWTLAVEVSFYLALPLLGLLALRLSRVPKWTLPAAIMAFGMAWSAALIELGGPLTLTKILPALLPYFGLGMLAATLTRKRTFGPRALGLIVLLGVGCQVVLESSASPTLIAFAHDLPVAVGFTALVVLASSARCPALLRARPLVAVGTVSYGLYLWHVPVIWWLRSVDALPLSPLAAAPVVLGLALALATLSWFCVERRAIAWAKRDRPGYSGRPIASMSTR